jgi:hypothetical protein
MGYLIYFIRDFRGRDFLKKVPSPNPIFKNFQTGGYLILLFLLYTKKRMNTRIPTKKAAFYNLCCTEFYKYLYFKRFWKGVRGEPFPQKGSPREIIFD